MTSRAFIVDASPLIALAQIDRLALLHELYPDLRAPSAVIEEIGVTVPTPPPWIIRQPLARPVPESGLDRGETEVIGLALELPGAGVILDELSGRRAAFDLGLTVTGTLGVLLLAKRRGLLPAIRGDVEALLTAGFYAGSKVVQMVLADAGEGDALPPPPSA